MKIAFAAQGVVGPSDGVADPRNPVTYVRSYLTGLALQAAGHEACMVPTLVQLAGGELVGSFEFPVGMVDQTYRARSPWLRPLAKRLRRDLFDGVDVVVTLGWMTRDAPEQIRRARANGQVVIADLADWLWCDTHAPGSPKSDDYSARYPNQNREHLRRVVMAADAVTVTTPYIAERIRRWGWNENVFVLRNMIDVPMWQNGQQRQTEDAGNRPTVGWYGETLLRHEDLSTLRGVLGPFLVDHGLRFVHVGDFPGQPAATELLGLDPATVAGTFEQVPIQQLPSLLATAGIDIGLVPLADHEFNAGKSFLKGLEMAAAGISFVAQAHPEYEALGAGILARTPQDWWQALERLLDPQERVKVAADGLARAAGHDWRARGQEWVEVYESLTSAGVPRRQSSLTVVP